MLLERVVDSGGHKTTNSRKVEMSACLIPHCSVASYTEAANSSYLLWFKHGQCSLPLKPKCKDLVPVIVLLRGVVDL
jgi:hypothetical protein